ncbi:MAG: uvrA [Patescibacteria group bacterium]|nr:uvrA [Patescibacteria group bacterium]
MTPKKKNMALGDGDSIIIKGARTHNLKNIDVCIPRGKMTAITGLSGSGKSSLAFDTIFAEGQRRYVESLSAYARQFLRQMAKPEVDEITGLSPAISIDQKSRSNNPRSTVATITEIYDYLRVLYARVGKPYCILCGRRIEKLSTEEILNFINEKIANFKTETKGNKKVMGVEWNETQVQVLAPVVRGRKGEYYQMLYDMLGKGYARARIDGTMRNLREKVNLDKNSKHDIDFVVDEIAIHEFKDDAKGAGERLAEAVELALTESESMVRIVFSVPGENTENFTDEMKANREFLMSATLSCPHDGFSYPEIEPRLFSFNSPYGACPECNGLGTYHLFGNENDDECNVCHGARLRPEALNVFLHGNTESDRVTEKNRHEFFNIVDLTNMPIDKAINFFADLKLTPKDREIAKIVLKEIEDRLFFMFDVGLSYLELNRRANTLSGGEAQRIRLASQLGSQLVGALYVLDEPTIGLHQRDNDRLINTLKNLRDLGNTIVVVEHDEDTIFASDYIVDIGPGAGVHGGNVVVQGYLKPLLEGKNKEQSLTIDYLKGVEKVRIPENRRDKDKGWLKVVGASVNNIHNINAELPLGRMSVISGVSGSGKSSFMYEIIYKNLQGLLERRSRTAKTYNAAKFEKTGELSRVIMIDQSPIGRTPRSNTATYTGMWTFIRDLFANTDEARVRGWKSNRFSFNVKGGRCEACQGNGEIAVEMHFLPTVYVTCDVCNGKRFDKETLKVVYKPAKEKKGKNIFEILELTIEEAHDFFYDIPAIADRLNTLMEVGLSYIKLGQTADTLSGGESQRVKISSELYRPMTQKTIYLLDEPTVGLHFEDVKKLIEVLNRLVERQNTVVLIEHNLDVIKSADYLLDFGPEGGTGGGKIVAKGTPEEVANNPASYTGKYLKKILKRK